MYLQPDNKLEVFNLIVISYNFISALINSFNKLISPISIIILGINMFLTIRTIQINGRRKMETICLVLEIMTAIIIIITIL